MSEHISPQPLAVGEQNSNPNQQTSHATQLTTNQAVQNLTKIQLKQIQYVHGEPTIQFTKQERQIFAQEEGLHQAVIIKFSSDCIEVKDLRTVLPKHLGIKGNCLVGLLARRHILLRIDQYEDYVVALSKSVSFLPFHGEQYLYRVFPWTIDFNPREETSMAAVWISLPRLSPDLFAKRSLLSMASAVGRPIAIDKETQDKTRPSTARVKVILNLMDKLPKRMRLQYLDEQTGKIQEVFEEFVYDNLPLYCNHCKHQGHDENSCRLMFKKNQCNNHKDDEVVREEQFNGEQFQGDLRQILNEKRGLENIDRSIDGNTRGVDANNNNEIALVEDAKNNGDRVVDTCVRDDTTVALNCNLTTVTQTLILGAKNGVTSDSVVPVINLDSDTTTNPKIPAAGVLSEKDVSLATIEDVGQVNKEQQCGENLDRIFELGGTCDHDFTLKDNDKEGWTEVPSNKRSPGSTKLQQLNCTNPTSKEQKVNCEDKVSRKVVCSNTFEALMINSDQEFQASTPVLQVSNQETFRIFKESQAAMLNNANPMVKPSMATINTLDHDVPSPSLESLGEQTSGQQLMSVRNDKIVVTGIPSISQTNFTNDLNVYKKKQRETSTSRWADIVEEEEHISSPVRSKLSPQAPIFVPSSKANPSMKVAIDNSKKNLTITTKVLEKNHELEAIISSPSPTTAHDIDLGSDMFDEDDEDDMLDTIFDKVDKDGDLSPRQRRSGSNKSKKKTHERQHSWDGKVTEEFILRHLPMRLAKQNHMTISTTRRSNISKKK